MAQNKSFLESIMVSPEIIKKTNELPKLIGKRYYYVEHYKADFLKHLKDEYNALHEAFPEVEIIPEARIKSFKSFSNKANKIISGDSANDIYDIFGNRYIINSVNGSCEDKDIIPILYKIRDFLAYSSSTLEVFPERTKDYVANPKHTTYQSLHITRRHISGGNYQSETQLRSYFMHTNAHQGKASHANTYKERIPGVTPVPNQLEYVFDENGFCIEVREKPFEKAFEDFFGIPYDPKMFPALQEK